MDESAGDAAATVRRAIALRVSRSAHCWTADARDGRQRFLPHSAGVAGGNYYAHLAALRAAPQRGARHPARAASAVDSRSGPAAPDVRPCDAVPVSPDLADPLRRMF